MKINIIKKTWIKIKKSQMKKTRNLKAKKVIKIIIIQSLKMIKKKHNQPHLDSGSWIED